jgi:DNA replication and repair protein RecF
MLTDIRLQNFRSYKDSSFEFDPGVNIIVGPNASGKTNLLEAILVVNKGSSYRVKDNDLIKFNESWSRIDADLSGGDSRSVKLEAGQSTQIDKTYLIDRKNYKRLSLNHKLPVVLFEPDNLRLFSAGPEKRRDYIDDLLSQIMPGYSNIRKQYLRVLNQRNSLLKQPTRDIHQQIFPWNLRLSELAGQIVQKRSNLIYGLDSKIGDLYKQLSKTNKKVNLDYQSSWPAEAYETNLLKKLEKNIETDQARGFTTSGPHREDMIIYFDKRPSQEVASRGEVRTAILALKITELELLESSYDSTPILLLDDVFSELDGKRRHALTDYIQTYQTFITTTDADIVMEYFTQTSHVIPLGS